MIIIYITSSISAYQGRMYAYDGRSPDFVTFWLKIAIPQARSIRVVHKLVSEAIKMSQEMTQGFATFPLREMQFYERRLKLSVFTEVWCDHRQSGRILKIYHVQTALASPRKMSCSH